MTKEQTLILHQLKTKEHCNIAITNEQTLLLYQLLREFVIEP